MPVIGHGEELDGEMPGTVMVISFTSALKLTAPTAGGLNDSCAPGEL